MMKPRNKKRVLWIIPGLIALLALCVTGYALYDRGRPAPVPAKRTLFDGAVTYHRRVYYLPRLVIAHVLVWIRNQMGSGCWSRRPITATARRSTPAPPPNSWMSSTCQIAINGDGFQPWWSRGPLDYYPQPGDPVTPNGFTASNGKVYAEGESTEPVLYISRRGGLSFRKPGRVFNAIAGDRYLLQGGEKVADLDNSERDPRTAIGFQ
jgi:hypothetical protein